MRAIARSTLRIAALLSAVLVCAWGALSYSDQAAFNRRNVDALAVCARFVPGMPRQEAERLAHAAASAVATVDGNLVLVMDHRRPCVVEFAPGVVRSAVVLRVD